MSLLRSEGSHADARQPSGEDVNRVEPTWQRRKAQGPMTDASMGGSLGSWLQGEDVEEHVTVGAIKRLLALRIEFAMTAEGISKTAMALRMGTSRSAVDRLLDPNNDSVTLATLRKAAVAVGRRARLEPV